MRVRTQCRYAAGGFNRLPAVAQVPQRASARIFSISQLFQCANPKISSFVRIEKLVFYLKVVAPLETKYEEKMAFHM